MSLADTLTRRTVPRAIVALSTVRWPGRAAAAARRALGLRGRVELYVAFDDPSSAVALLGLVERLEGRAVDLVVEPVVTRGIEGDPAVGAKRAYAVTDARRLALRDDREITRFAPLTAADTAGLAARAAALSGADRTAFCTEAMRRLWFESDGPLPALDDLPAAEGDPAASERRFRRRKLYDTPVAVVHGQWFFAHERLAAIEHRLDELGWT